VSISWVDSNLLENHLKRVLVIHSKHLLIAGILRLLSRETDLNVLNATCNDELVLLEHIKNFKPAVLVLDGSSQLTYRFLFFSLLNDCPDLRVIVVDERKNRMHIYELQELEIERTADLLTVIRREDHPLLIKDEFIL
jgi:chemotaxis response regulator CheB